MNKVKCLVVAVTIISFSLLSGCIKNNNVADVNVSMPKHRWSYIDKVTAQVDIKDHTKTYDLFFKLRHTAKYRYSNIYILFHFKAPGEKEVTRRYEYKLAQLDGHWLGAGSGDLFSSTFPLLRNYKFPAAGKYTLVVEQAMRDNPLHHISDAGIMVSTHEDPGN
ncbi:gliding motility lipoprotein GldH [Pedobacter immunditicola]|uniref:gliding motility lipoprotein GldH n=1 Tax=Pedobacter immunditicola TaxID=3133440 RepID=UPI0030B19626